MLHGVWLFSREVTPLLAKPNAYLDYSAQSLLIPPATLAQTLREWLERGPEKIMFGTHPFPYLDEMGWGEGRRNAGRRGGGGATSAATATWREDGVWGEGGGEGGRVVGAEKAQRVDGLRDLRHHKPGFGCGHRSGGAD